MLNVSFVPGRLGPFRLRDLQNGEYQIHCARGPAFEGPKLKIFMKAVELGIVRSDLRLATQEMKKLGHNCAEFGIGGRFLYTRKDSKSKVA